MSDLVDKFFEEDLTEAEEEALEGMLESSDEAALKLLGKAEAAYFRYGLPDPPVPSSGPAVPTWLVWTAAGLTMLGAGIWWAASHNKPVVPAPSAPRTVVMDGTDRTIASHMGTSPMEPGDRESAGAAMGVAKSGTENGAAGQVAGVQKTAATNPSAHKTFLGFLESMWHGLSGESRGTAQPGKDSRSMQSSSGKEAAIPGGAGQSASKMDARKIGKASSAGPLPVTDETQAFGAVPLKHRLSSDARAVVPAHIRMQQATTIEAGENLGDLVQRMVVSQKDAGPVVVRVLTPDGREVRRLYEGMLEQGEWIFKWDGMLPDGTAAKPGVYQIEISNVKILGREDVLIPTAEPIPAGQ